MPGDVITTQTYSQGSGTVDDPFLIYTDSDLMGIGLNPVDWDKHFKLMSDIDLSGYTGTEFTIIQSFSGVFDGNGHAINNFNYTSNGIDRIGLFKFSTGTIKNLNLINVNIQIENGEYIGSIVGYNNGGVLVQRELDKSVLQLRDFWCLGQIMNPPLAGLFYQVF